MSSIFLNFADLSSKVYASGVRPRIFADETFDASYYGLQGTAISDTASSSSLLVVDAFHNAVSMSMSLSSLGGSRIFSPSTGIFFNNVISEFREAVAVIVNQTEIRNLGSNFLGPLKRPVSSICPVIILRDSEFFLAIGSNTGTIGGAGVITATLEAILDTIAYDFDLSQTIGRFRIHHQLDPNVVFVERGYPSTLLRGLSSRGHNVTTLESGEIIGELALIIARSDGNLESLANTHKIMPFQVLPAP